MQYVRSATFDVTEEASLVQDRDQEINNLQPLYLSPNYMAQATAWGYTQSQLKLLREFAERGYVTIELGLSEKHTQQIIADLAPEYSGRSKYKTGPGRVQDAATESVAQLAANTEVLQLLEMLYGRRAFPFQTLNFNRGTQQATHSDTIHFDSLPHGFMAGVWVALEDVDPANGPLHYYPGSHRLPQFTFADFGKVNARRHYESVYEPGIRRVIAEYGLHKEEAYLRRGQALIWSANLLHGGSPIQDPTRSRHSQVTHYYFDNCAYLTPMLSNPMLGSVFVRAPKDIRTGKRVSSVYGGRRLPAIRERLYSLAGGLLRRA